MITVKSFFVLTAIAAAAIFVSLVSMSGAERGHAVIGGDSELARVPFSSPLNLIIIEATIEGSKPLRFFLDSGATSTIVDVDAANRLGLDTGTANTRRGTAANSQVTVAPVNGGVDFLLAPEFEIHVNSVITAPFTQTAKVMVGAHFDGILGSAFFRQFVIEVDYAKRVLVFHDPARYEYNGSGSVLDLDFPARMPSLPFIKTTLVNGEHTLTDMPILVDSGGQTMGTASVAYRSQWDAMLTPDNRVVDAMGATGLSNSAEGTTHEAFVTRMDLMKLGTFEFEGPLVSYSAGGPGIAVMGASLLHRFTVVFDYARNRLILEPNANFESPPVFDRSGLMLVLSGGLEGYFEAMFVSDGTPADEAGLVRGDLILAVDGVPAHEIRLNDARQMFCRDSSYRLEVQRGETRFETVMKTHSLFDD